MSKIIGIVSGKGGVGKTTLCAGLAFALASLGKNVIALDGDVGLKNLDILLGMADNTAFDLTDILAERCTIGKAVQVHEKFSNLHFISASQNAEADSIDKTAFRKLCRYLRTHYDYVLIDAPAGLGAGFYNIIDSCDECLVVATSDLTSIRDAEKTAGILSGINNLTAYLVLNKINQQMIKKGYLQNIDDVIDNISLQLIGLIPADNNMVLYSNIGTPIINTKSVCAQPVKNIAKRIMGESVPLDKRWRK